jgi:uncharacterized surface protein with fasciclin (FAS1) repeats
MRSIAILPLAAAATAFVVPDIETFSQLPIHGQVPHSDDSSSWQDWFPSAESISSSVHDVVDSLSSNVEEALHAVEDKLETELESLFDEEEEDTAVDELDWPHRGHGGGRHGHHGHDKSDLTIYQLISQSKYTTKLAALVDEHEDIVQLLNSTSANYTLFAPIDSAFEHIPKDKKPSKEFVEAVLKYHVGLGLYPARRVCLTHTLPTALDEPLLGNKPQRLRTSVGWHSGVRVNFYSKVVAADIVSFAQPPPFYIANLTLYVWILLRRS